MPRCWLVKEVEPAKGFLTVVPGSVWVNVSVKPVKHGRQVLKMDETRHLNEGNWGIRRWVHQQCIAGQCVFGSTEDSRRSVSYVKKSLAKGHQVQNLLKRLHGAGARKTSACVHPSRCSLWINMVSQEGDWWLEKLALGGIDIVCCGGAPLHTHWQCQQNSQDRVSQRLNECSASLRSNAICRNSKIGQRAQWQLFLAHPMAGSTPAGTRGHGQPWKDISCYQASEVLYVKNRVQASGCGVVQMREIATRVPNGISISHHL